MWETFPIHSGVEPAQAFMRAIFLFEDIARKTDSVWRQIYMKDHLNSDSTVVDLRAYAVVNVVTLILFSQLLHLHVDDRQPAVHSWSTICQLSRWYFWLDTGLRSVVWYLYYVHIVDLWLVPFSGLLEKATPPRQTMGTSSDWSSTDRKFSR